MFEHGPSIFPHPASAWWVPILFVFGPGLFLVLYIIYPDPGRDSANFAKDFGLPWGIGIALPCWALLVVAILTCPR